MVNWRWRNVYVAFHGILLPGLDVQTEETKIEYLSRIYIYIYIHFKEDDYSKSFTSFLLFELILQRMLLVVN